MRSEWITATFLCTVQNLIVSCHAFTTRGIHDERVVYERVNRIIARDDHSHDKTWRIPGTRDAYAKSLPSSTVCRNSLSDAAGVDGTTSKQLCYVPDESPEIQGMIQLLQELECEGVGPDEGESGVEIGFHPVTGLRGMFAKEDLGVGEFLFAVPFPASLVVMEEENESTTDADRGLVLLQKYLNPSLSSWREIQQKWRPYLNCLPTKDYCFSPTPDFWSREDIELLEFPRIVQEALRRKEQVRLLAESQNVDCDLLQFATWLAKSRCFSVVKLKDGIVKTRSILIPFFDMINHSSKQPNAELQLIETRAANESFYALCATSPISAGSEVTISYGTTKDSSVELLMNYGILEQSNPFDVEMLKAGGSGCLNRLEDWRTSLEDDENELLTAHGNSRIALAFRAQLKRAISSMSSIS